MDYRPTGVLSPRIDSTGNLGFFDASGNEVLKVIGTVVSGAFNIGIVNNSTNRSTTSISDVSSGSGVSITPRVSNRVSLTGVVFLADSTTANVSLNYPKIYRNITGIPAFGAGPGTDTLLYSARAFSPNNSGVDIPVGFFDTGLTLGVTYFYYVAFVSPVGTDTVTITVRNLIAEEV